MLSPTVALPVFTKTLSLFLTHTPETKIAPTRTTGLLPIPSSTPLPAPDVFSAIPTLENSEREEKIRELLRTNAGCDLPCWWGIFPGETRWSEAESFFKSLGINTRSAYIPEADGTIYHGLGGTDFDQGSVNDKILNIYSADFAEIAQQNGACRTPRGEKVLVA